MEHDPENKTIADLFIRMADILEYLGDDAFKINAYRKAAISIKRLNVSIIALYNENKLRSVPGIGPALEKKIAEYISTGSMKKYEEIIHSVSPGIIELLEMKHMGPKTVQLLQQRLGIQNRMDLLIAIESDALKDIPGLGHKTVAQILQALQ